MYPGVAPFSGAGYGGNSSCCVCRVSRFDLDRYGRLALPNVVTCSVTVPSSSWKSSVAAWLTLSSIPVRVTFLNPAISTLTS
jgi:hypothetical protein